jgi:hypothetical protein
MVVRRPRLLAMQPMQVAQRGEIFDRESHRVEDRHFGVVRATRSSTGHDLGELDDGEVRRHLLHLTLDARLRLVLDDDARVGPREDRAGELGLARAVAAHGVQVHAGLDHLGREDDGVALVGGDGGDDVGAARGLARRGASHHAQALEPERGEVALELGCSSRVHVEEAQLADADEVMERDRLELALRAVADQRHRAAVLARHPARGERGHRGGAQRGGERELGKQDRVARGDLGEHAERGDGEQPLGGVLRVAVDVLERVQLAVGDRHQLDDAHARVRGVARRFVELVPAEVVRLDLARQRLDEGGGAHAAHQFLDALDARVVDHCSLPASMERRRPPVSVGGPSGARESIVFRRGSAN